MRRCCRTLLHLALAVICYNAVFVVGICSQGFVDISGQCVPQSTTCPQNYGLLNGMCYPATTTQCPNGQVSVNGQCCTYECNLKCPPQTHTPYPNQPLTPNQPVTPCPNQPVTPYPNQPVAPCPNQPLLPNQPVAPCPNQPVTPYPNQPIAPCPNQPLIPNQPVAPCPNQPVTPYPNQPAAPCPNQPLLPNQPVTPYPNQPVTPYPNQPVAPCPNQPLVPNQPVAPYPNQPVTPYPNQPAAPCPNQPLLPNQPCPNQPVLPYPTFPLLTTTPTPATTATVITSTTTRTPLPPPAEIVRCPAGTILIGGACRLIYCGKGVYMNKRCVQTQCPKLTVWTGIQCEPPKPIVHSVVFNNTVITHFDHTVPDVIVNNVNNMIVNASIALPLHQSSQLPSPSTDCDQSEEGAGDCNTMTESTTTPADQSKCCTVMTPRMCRPNAEGSRWNCYNRRYRRCGEFCIAPTIYLRAPQPRRTESYIVLPPDLDFVSDCRRSRTCPESQDIYNCSGCVLGHAESCSSYCYQYLCPKQACSFYDQRDYCSSQSPNEYGCQEQDGCQDPWCSEGY